MNKRAGLWKCGDAAAYHTPHDLGRAKPRGEIHMQAVIAAAAVEPSPGERIAPRRKEFWQSQLPRFSRFLTDVDEVKS